MPLLYYTFLKLYRYFYDIYSKSRLKSIIIKNIEVPTFSDDEI